VACLPAAVSLLLLAALLMQISGVSLALTWPCRLCLLRVLLCTCLLQAFPFPSTPGEVTLHPLSLVCMFIYSSRGRWVFPPTCGVFLPPPLLQAFPLLIAGQCCCSCQLPCLFTAHVGSHSFPLSCGVFLPLPLSQAFPLLVAGCAPPLLPEPLRPGWLVYLQFQKGFPSPTLWSSGRPTLFATCLYCSYCLLLTFSFFPGWRSVCPGDYALFWPRVVCGSTAYRLVHLVCVFPSHLGAGCWWCGDSLRRLEVWRGQSFASSQWFCL
jgi:hypothetical protein